MGRFLDLLLQVETASWYQHHLHYPILYHETMQLVISKKPLINRTCFSSSYDIIEDFGKRSKT